MPEPTNTNPDSSKGADPINPNPGNDPGNKGGFDPSKVGDEEFAKIFDDPRTFNHPRFKELTKAQQELKKIKEDQAKAQEALLEKEKKHEELAQLRGQERDDAINKYTTAQIDNAIIIEAAKKGITDLDAAKKLIDRANVKVSENGSIEGVTEAVDALLKDKPYLKGKTGGVGTGTNPSNPEANSGKFTMTQIADPIFYEKNRDAILMAQAKGEIVDDRQ